MIIICKIGVLKNLANFMGKHLCWCFPVNFEKFLRTPFTQNTFGRLLKACVGYFLSNFYFSLNDNPSKSKKNIFLFHLKSYFRSQDIQIFVFPSSPLFLPVSLCFRGSSKISLKVSDVINCINKNLIRHFVWYLEKGKSYDIETLPIDRVLNKEIFYWKIMQKMCFRD